MIFAPYQLFILFGGTTNGHWRVSSIEQMTTAHGVTAVRDIFSTLNSQNANNLVRGPISSLNNSVVRFDGSSGSQIKDSTVQVSDSGDMTFSGGSRITNLADPIAAGDAATKAYVDFVAGGGGGSTTTQATFSCLASVAVGDVVYSSGSGTVDKAFAGIVGQTADAIGIVSAKPTSTTAVVVSHGPVTIFVGLTPSSVYYVSTVFAGQISSAIPTTTGTKLQSLGVATDPTQLFVDISSIAVLN